MKYIKVSEAAEKWGISARRVRLLCEQGRIAGVERKGNLYIYIPAKMEKVKSEVKKNSATQDFCLNFGNIFYS